MRSTALNGLCLKRGILLKLNGFNKMLLPLPAPKKLLYIVSPLFLIWIQKMVVDSYVTALYVLSRLNGIHCRSIWVKAPQIEMLG